MNDVACRSELVLRERRGELSSAERTALAAHLASCEACRLSRQLGRDFDEGAALEPGDGQRIFALSEAARRGAAAPSSGSARERFVAPDGGPRVSPAAWRRRTRLVAAAFPLLLVAAASAAFGVYRTRSVETPAPPVATTPRAAPDVVTRARVPPRAAEPVASAAAPEAKPRSAPAPLEKPAVVAVSAAERFELANAARRGGDIARAIALYREVENDFPNSPEAAASELRLGSLLLERGKPGAALAQFDRHLRRGGALVPEALYGRGRALAALDEATAEAQVWSRVLREFASSPYAAHARRRLATLERGGAAPAR
jgi:TolA-binding protein